MNMQSQEGSGALLVKASAGASVGYLSGQLVRVRGQVQTQHGAVVVQLPHGDPADNLVQCSDFGKQASRLLQQNEGAATLLANDSALICSPVHFSA